MKNFNIIIEKIFIPDETIRILNYNNLTLIINYLRNSISDK